MASACGRLQQWDRVLDQWLGIAGCGGQSTARLTLKGKFSAFDGFFLNHIALGGFLYWFFFNGSFCCFCCVHFKIHFDQPQVQQHLGEATLADEFFPNSPG